VARRIDRGAKKERSREGEVAGSDHTDVSLAREHIDFLVVRR
jgi:hypothetical protein